jgi:hypothetical protein
MHSIDFVSGTTSLLVAMSGTAAAVAVVFIVAAWRRSATRAGLRMGLAAVVLATVAAGMAVLAGSTAHERLLDRLAIARRAAELQARVLLPGSPLACLDGLTGTAAEPMCEAVLFGRPENTAMAVSYVAAQVTLLADAAFASASDPEIAQALALVRRALAADRFGVVAHVLAARAGCTADACDVLTLLESPERVRSNLRERPFDGRLRRHASAWPVGSDATDANGNPAPYGGTYGPSATGASLVTSPELAGTGKPFSSRYDPPSAASIPPVSIMMPESGGPGAAPATRVTPAVPARAPKAAPLTPSRTAPDHTARPSPTPDPAAQRPHPAPPSAAAGPVPLAPR